MADSLPRGPVSEFGAGGDRWGDVFDWLPRPNARHWRALVLLLGLCVGAGNVYLGTLEWKSGVLYGRAYMALRSAPVQALSDTVTAFQTYPWDWEVRQQVYLSLRNLTLHQNVVMDRETERWAWDVSASASPYSPLLHASKIEVPDDVQDP